MYGLDSYCIIISINIYIYFMICTGMTEIYEDNYDGCSKAQVLDSQGVSRTVFIPMHLEKLYMDAKKDSDSYNDHTPRCPACTGYLKMSVRPRITRDEVKKMSYRVYDRVIKCEKCLKAYLKQTRTYYVVNYSKAEIQRAKSLGMRYDGYVKCWYIFKSSPVNNLKLAALHFDEIDYRSLLGDGSML